MKHVRSWGCEVRRKASIKVNFDSAIISRKYKNCISKRSEVGFLWGPSSMLLGCVCSYTNQTSLAMEKVLEFNCGKISDTLLEVSSGSAKGHDDVCSSEPQLKSM